MAKRFITFSLLVAALFLFGFDGKVLLSDYTPNSAEEEKIIATLIEYQKAYNDKDAERLLSFISSDAQLKPCGDFVQISKDEYAKIFPDKWRSFPEYNFYNLKIQITGKEAKLNLMLETGGWVKDYDIEMVKENGQWLIQKTFY